MWRAAVRSHCLVDYNRRQSLQDECAAQNTAATATSTQYLQCYAVFVFVELAFGASVFMPLVVVFVSPWGVNMGWVPGYVYPADLSRVLAFLGWLPVRPSGCTATSTAPGAEARPHDGLACQVSAATVLGKGSHGRRFHSTIDAPRPLLGGFVTLS